MFADVYDGFTIFGKAVRVCQRPFEDSRTGTAHFEPFRKGLREFGDARFTASPTCGGRKHCRHKQCEKQFDLEHYKSLLPYFINNK